MAEILDTTIVKSQDALQMYYGYDYSINENIIIKQPRMKHIVEMGEEKYYGMVFNLTTIPSDVKSVLFDVNIDYMETSNLEMFAMIAPTVPKEDTHIIFGDLDFSKFNLYKKEDGDLIFWNVDDNIVIDSYVHRLISSHLCKLHGIRKKIEHAGNKYTKSILIEEERSKRLANSRKVYESQLLSQISYLENSAGSKYNKEQILEMNIFHFTDSVNRLLHIDAVNHLTNSYYSGNIDTKKFDTKKLNYIKNLYSDDKD